MFKILIAVAFFTAAFVYVTINKKNVLPWTAFAAGAATLFFLLYSLYSLPVYSAMAVLFAVLFACAHHDVYHGHLYTGHLAAVLIASGAVRFFLDIPPLHTVFSAALAFLALYLPYRLSKKKWLGSGDIAVFASLGLTLEPFSVPMVLALSGLAGSACFVPSIITGRPARQIPFIPVLSLSYFLFYPLQYRLWEILFQL